MEYGAGWVIFEESSRDGTRILLSVLSPRRTTNDISAFIEQLHIDRHGSIRERLQYKKSRKSAAYKTTLDGHGGLMQCGHEPYLVGIHAHKISLRNRRLEFTDRIRMNGGEGSEAKFEERHQWIAVDD